MTVPAPTRLIHAPWVGVAGLPADRPALGDDSDAVWQELCWRASELLYLLSGRQWAGAADAIVVLERPASCGRGDRWPVWRPTGGWPNGTLLPVRPVREGNVVVALPDPPVAAVDEVTFGGDPFGGWTAWLPAGHLERTDGRPWPLDGTCAVRFRHGASPPSGGVEAAASLALELGKARVRDGSCRLPKRVTTLQRENMTVSLLDPGEHLDDRRTGLLDVDAWLRSVNPAKLTRRMSAWSPDQPRTRRASTP